MGCLTRRSFIKRFLSGITLPLFHSKHMRISTPHGGLPLIGRRGLGEKGLVTGFQGEELRYQIQFLWFTCAAIGRVLFEEDKGKGIYRATLEGRTSGVIGWLTQYRRDTYTSFMELIDGGRRLRSRRFEEDIVIGGKIRKKIIHFDYRKGKLIKRRMNRRGVFIQTEEKIPKGVIYDDFITAFYNFRCGVYGKIQRGKRYRIRTLPKARVSTIDVEIATKEDEMRMRQGEGDKGLREYYIMVFLDREITRSRTGKVTGWVSKNLVPLEGTIEDVVFFGDVHGVLIGKRSLS